MQPLVSMAPPQRKSGPDSRTRAFLLDLQASISRNQTFDLAAQLAYWSILALFPFAIFTLTLLGFIPLEGLDRQLMDFIYRAMPGDAARLVDQTIHEIVGKQRGWLLVLSLLGALWSASGGVSATVTALNRAYEVAETRGFLRRKLVALGMTLSGSVMIAVALVSLMLGPGLVRQGADLLGLGGVINPVWDRVWAWVRWPLVVSALMLMMAIFYYFLPNVKQRFRLISPGAICGVLLWIGASLLFGAYVSNFGSYAKTYGALGAVVVLLTWLYLSGFIVILGGEINASLDRVLRGIRHSERVPGTITVADRGQTVGSSCPKQGPKLRRIA